MEPGLFPLNTERVTKSEKLAPSSMFSKHIQRSGTEGIAEASVAYLTAENSAPDTLNRVPLASLSCDSSEVTHVDASVATMTTVNVPTTALDHAASHVNEIPETASVGSSSTASTCDTAVPSASFQVETNIPVKGPESPICKHPKFPKAPASNSKKKAISGHDYRKLLQERKALK
ncbi:hypothetical protein DPMN_037717 [Dreissena polymorpha]|uniref:Uncharacterized protein n=1 Tax=Dreissena polymorpha TaxID=45954 RepID=A0A9D4RQ35_DREPO|nr:hypothetical protein DPMN_037717 [Dreissena polymorpha]